MNQALKFFLVLLCGIFSVLAVNAQEDTAVREKLSRSVLAGGVEQQKLVGELGDTGSKLVHDVLVAWTHDTVFIYETGGAKVPVVLEEQTDADGKATVAWTLGNRIGVQKLTAAFGSVTGSPITFTATVLF